ncbi:hypothetical protein WDW37_18205 [Bdellovibrionota bacterium FG-1]
MNIKDVKNVGSTQSIKWMLFFATFCACSSAPVARTKYSDHAHRVFLSPKGISGEDYVAIQASLSEVNRFFIVDRSSGFNAVRREQAMIHRDDIEAFNDADKYSRLGALYSVGAVIVANAHCTRIEGFLGPSLMCRQYISAVDASTGLVIVAVSGTSEARMVNGMPSWDDTVDKFCKAFPTTWESNQNTAELETYRKLAGEEARKQKLKPHKEQPTKDDPFGED